MLHTLKFHITSPNYFSYIVLQDRYDITQKQVCLHFGFHPFFNLFVDIFSMPKLSLVVNTNVRYFHILCIEYNVKIS